MRRLRWRLRRRTAAIKGRTICRVLGHRPNCIRGENGRPMRFGHAGIWRFCTRCLNDLKEDGSVRP